ncbi:hypothetical protein [Mycoplasma sp. P36-A1]|uniref:hypothetical protein n=1 Tax=Mycoplasma sp. P36-A1 TaxID=3252900 RepID=UPI003C2D31C8
MKKNDLYTLTSDTVIDFHDYKVINQLYQPIMGMMATNIYMLLWSEVEFNKILNKPISLVDRLCKITNLADIDITKAIDILSSLDLVNIYMKSTDTKSHYHLILKAPMSPNSFYKTIALRNQLYLYLGKDNYEKTKLLFKINTVDIEDYKNVSKKYSDIFDLGKVNFNINDNIKTEKEIRPHLQGKTDLNLIAIALKPYNMDKLLTNHLYKQHIEMVDLAYKVSIDQLVDAIVESVDGQNLDVNLLEQKVKNKSENNKNNKPLNLVYVNPKSSQDEYGNNSVLEFMNKHYSRFKLTIDKLKELEQIMQVSRLKPSMMNMLLEYTINTQKFINIKWISLVANTIKEYSFETDLEVADYLKSLSNKENKSKDKAKKNYQKKNYYEKETLGIDDNLYTDNIEKPDDHAVKEVLERMRKERANNERNH